MSKKPAGKAPGRQAVTPPDAAPALLMPETARALEAELHFFALQGKEKLDPKLWPVLASPLRIASRAKIPTRTVQKLRRDSLYRRIFLWRVLEEQLKKADAAELAKLEATELAASLTGMASAAIEKRKHASRAQGAAKISATRRISPAPRIQTQTAPDGFAPAAPDWMPPSVLGNLKAQARKKAEMTWLKSHQIGDSDGREQRIAKLQLDLMALNFELNMLWQQGMPPAAPAISAPAE